MQRQCSGSEGKSRCTRPDYDADGLNATSAEVSVLGARAGARDVRAVRARAIATAPLVGKRDRWINPGARRGSEHLTLSGSARDGWRSGGRNHGTGNDRRLARRGARRAIGVCSPDYNANSRTNVYEIRGRKS